MIHCYKLGGLNIVLDICSGSVHVVDEVAYDMIESFEKFDRGTLIDKIAEKYAGRDDVTREDAEECYEQIVELKNEGKLFTPDTFEPLAGELKQKNDGIVKALCLHVAHTCNLNCSYCFASQGKYH
ncbi:MAG: thioether cross-link-forming SCIFF peptide maturase, partial [Eubacteriales bacterium]